MAKSTTTTKAKTKTRAKKAPAKTAAKSTKAKKPAAKAAAKSSAAKSTKPTKPASTAAASARKVVQPIWRRSQVLTAALYAALAVAAGFLMNTSSAQALLGHLAKDELASRSGTVLAPAATALYEVEFRWLLVGLLVVAAVIALLRGTRYHAKEQAGVKARVQPLRWVEFAVTGALAFHIVALLNGVQDFVALALGVFSIAVAAVMAWAFERENAATGKSARASYVVAITAVVVPVLALLVTMYGTYVYGMERSAWYAYAAAAVVAVSLLVTVRSAWNAFAVRNGAHDYTFVDRNYNRIAVVSKTVLAVVLIIGLYAK